MRRVEHLGCPVRFDQTCAALREELEAAVGRQQLAVFEALAQERAEAFARHGRLRTLGLLLSLAQVGAGEEADLEDVAARRANRRLRLLKCEGELSRRLAGERRRSLSGSRGACGGTRRLHGRSRWGRSLLGRGRPRRRRRRGRLRRRRLFSFPLCARRLDALPRGPHSQLHAHRLTPSGAPPPPHPRGARRFPLKTVQPPSAPPACCPSGFLPEDARRAVEDDLLLLGDDPLDLIDWNTAHSAREQARPHDQHRRLTIGAKADVIHRAEALPRPGNAGSSATSKGDRIERASPVLLERLAIDPASWTPARRATERLRDALVGVDRRPPPRTAAAPCQDGSAQRLAKLFCPFVSTLSAVAPPGTHLRRLFDARLSRSGGWEATMKTADHFDPFGSLRHQRRT